jgi:LacI family transcriptional regulator
MTCTKAVEELMSLPPAQKPTAVFCPTAPYAMYVLQTLYDLDIKVPRDISVAGYGSLQIAFFASTIEKPFEELGMKSCKLLIEEIRNGGGECFTGKKFHKLPVKLVVRKSTASI